MTQDAKTRAEEELRREDEAAERRRLAERANQIESRERYARMEAEDKARVEAAREAASRRDLLEGLRMQRDVNEPRLIRGAQAELDTARRNLAEAERRLADMVDRHEATCRAIDRLETLQ